MATFPYAQVTLDYDFDDLEPHIDAQTMEVHYSGHHAAYLKNLNNIMAPFEVYREIELPDLLKKLNDLPEQIREQVKNNAGGAHNHNLFWKWLTPRSTKPTEAMSALLNAQFGSFQVFQQEFTHQAINLFGSGWVWLIQRPDKSLSILATHNQDNPVMTDPDVLPVLGLDVWEHAYYLKHQNRRAEYVEAWWSVINWPCVEELLAIE